VRWAGAPGPGWVSLARSGPPGRHAVRRRVQGPTGEVELRALEGSWKIEVRYEQDLGHGAVRLVDRLELASVQAETSVVVPEKVFTVRPLEVAWEGAGNAGDAIAVFTADADGGRLVGWASASGGSPLELATPTEEGEYEVRYLSGLTDLVLARAGLLVEQPEATLDASDSVMAGTSVVAEWSGPDGPGDAVLLVPAGSQTGSYRSMALTSSGSPAALEVPAEAGSYELRYVSGDGDRVLWSEPLEVTGVEVAVSAPAVVTHGERFEVSWTGPDAVGDFVTIVRPRTPEDRYTSWAYTSEGSPTSLPAPLDPGVWQVRYVSGPTGEILATQEVTVE